MITVLIDNKEIVNLHQQKRDLAESLLEETDAVGKISAPELLGLLHGEQGRL